MCAYNSINGQPACANQFLLQDQLRGNWGFKALRVLRLRRGFANIMDRPPYEPSQPRPPAP